jgi:hypothetical protein
VLNQHFIHSLRLLVQRLQDLYHDLEGYHPSSALALSPHLLQSPLGRMAYAPFLDFMRVPKV